MKTNRKSGRFSILGLGAVAIVSMIIASIFLAKEDPSSIGGQFMDALARHDVAKLTELSYVSSSDPKVADEEKKRLQGEWDFSVNMAGKHYPFMWRITGSNSSTDTTSSVTVQVTRGGPGGMDEKFELPMEKQNGKWFVDVGSISRMMFPALPN
jgi:hypothetical protein